MLGTTGRYGVEFRHVTPGTWERHQMLNSDDRGAIELAFAVSTNHVELLGSRSDVIAIRLVDHTANAVVNEWSAA